MADLNIYRPGLGKGVNVSQSPLDIDPNDTPFCDGFFIRKGRLNTWPAFNSTTLIGVTGTVVTAIGNFQSATLAAPSLVITDNNGKLYVYNTGTGQYNSVVTGGGTGTILSSPIDLVVYNEVIYYTVGNCLSSWDGTTATANITNSVGSRYLSKLSSHLLAIHTFEGANNFPFRVRWSGNGAPNNWNPATDLTSGFNDLDVSELSGVVENTNFNLLFTPQSIIQMNPTGSGQNPFSFIPYTGGNKGVYFKGVGNKYIYSLDTNGIYSAFVADDDVYMISPYGLQPIGGAARDSIFADLATANLTAQWVPHFDESNAASFPMIIGSIVAAFKNSFIFPAYILAIPQGTQSGSDTTILWHYNIIDQNWTRRTIHGWLMGKIKTIYYPTTWSLGQNPENFYRTIYPISSSTGAP